MLVHRKVVKRNMHLITEETPEFLDMDSLEFEGLQETLHLFVVGHRPFDWCGFDSVFMVFANGADNIVPIAVKGIEEVFFLLNMWTLQNFQIQVISIGIFLLNNLETNSIQPVIHVFNLHGFFLETFSGFFCAGLWASEQRPYPYALSEDDPGASDARALCLLFRLFPPPGK